MIRVQAFIVRRPDVSRDAFRAHYEEIHVPLALPLLVGTCGYVRHHVREELHGRPPFDVMTVFEYPDAATVAAVFARIEGPEAGAVHADEQSFMHTPANFFFPVEEGPAWQALPARAARDAALVCVRRAPGEERASFRARFAERVLSELRGALEQPCSLRAFWPRTPSARFDATLLCGAAGPGALSRTARELERDGCEVIAVRVSSHATPMPAGEAFAR